MATDNGFRYPVDIHTALEPWRQKLGSEFDSVVSRLSDRDRRLEDEFGAGRWLDYTPTITCPGGVNPYIGDSPDAVALGRYTRFGRTVHGNARIQFGVNATAGTGTYFISLPTPRNQQSPYSISAACGAGDIFDNSSTTRLLVVPRLATNSTTGVVLSYEAGAGAAGVVTNAAPWTWADNDIISICFTYEGEQF